MVRVRFAPSPTGFLHIGSLKTALYNFLFAQKNKGKLILRIEDTDIKREIPGAVENLIKVLKEVGLNWDEGPFLANSKKQIANNKIKQKGKYGPYIQSQRLDIYRKFAQKLIDNGHAYYCFCRSEDLEKMRQEQIAKKLPPMYDERCRKLSKNEVTLRLRSEQPYVIRLKVPEEGSIKFHDLIRDEIEFDFKNVDDQVLLKSDGYPTYHLAVVVDDHLMKITHVIRGEEWLPSVPKHLLIYQAFGWPLPQFAHLPLLLNPDRSKLSKRQGDVAVEDYLAKGYLPEAILNFVALLGWNPGTDQEIFSLKELIKEFSLEKIQKAGAIFNLEKLDWTNGYYIRKMSVNELTKRCIHYLVQSNLIKPLNPKSKILNPKSTRIPLGSYGISEGQIQNFPTKVGIPIRPKLDSEEIGTTVGTKFQIFETKEIVSFDWLKKIVALEQERMKKLSDIYKLTDFFFQEKLDYDPKILTWKKMTPDEVVNSLNLVKNQLEKISEKLFRKEKIQNLLDELAKQQGTGQIFWPFRVALSGKEASPPPAEITEILGKEKTIKRIEGAIELLSY